MFFNHIFCPVLYMKLLLDIFCYGFNGRRNVTEYCFCNIRIHLDLPVHTIIKKADDNILRNSILIIFNNSLYIGVYFIYLFFCIFSICLSL